MKQVYTQNGYHSTIRRVREYFYIEVNFMPSAYPDMTSFMGQTYNLFKVINYSNGKGGAYTIDSSNLNQENVILSVKRAIEQLVHPDHAQPIVHYGTK